MLEIPTIGVPDGAGKSRPGLELTGEDVGLTVLTMTLQVIVECGEDGYFVARCPSLKGCWSQGRTRDEAVKNIREAIELYLEPSTAELVTNEDHELVTITV